MNYLDKSFLDTVNDYVKAHKPLIVIDVEDEKLLFNVAFVLYRNHNEFLVSDYVSRKSLLYSFHRAMAVLANEKGANIFHNDEKRIKKLDCAKIEKFSTNQIVMLTNSFDYNYMELLVRQGKTIEEQERILRKLCISNKRSENKYSLADIGINIAAGEYLPTDDKKEDATEPVAQADEEEIVRHNRKCCNRRQAIFLMHHSEITSQEKLTYKQYGAVLELLTGFSHSTCSREYGKYSKEDDLPKEEAEFVLKGYNRLCNNTKD